MSSATPAIQPPADQFTQRPYLARIGLIVFWPVLAVWAVWVLWATGAVG